MNFSVKPRPMQPAPVPFDASQHDAPPHNSNEIATSSILSKEDKSVNLTANIEKSKLDSYNPAAVVAFLQSLDHASAGGITEIRILSDEQFLQLNGNTKQTYVGKTVSGYYTPDNYEKAAADIAPYDGHAHIYATLNPVKSDLLARANNRLQTNAKHTTSDADILFRKWLAIDIDAVRPAGISSSESELQAALDTRDEIADYLQERGVDCIKGASGNGGHLLVRLQDSPNDEAHKAQAKEVLERIGAMFSSKSAHVDEAVHNTARIWKLYGTIACKGDPLPERPHRRASVDLPETQPEPVELSALLEMFPAVEMPLTLAPLKPSSATYSNGTSAPAGDHDRAYYLKKLDGIREQMAAVPVGEKHNRRLQLARNLGGDLWTGHITEADILQAVGVNLKDGDSKELKAIQDGIKDGKAAPRDKPPLQLPNEHKQLHDVYVESKAATPMPQFKIVGLHDIFTRPRLEYLIQDILLERGTALISADYGAFKSFTVLSMGLCVALGMDWHDRKTKRGTVVYIIAEGAYTTADRAKAFLIRHQVDAPKNFHLIETPIQIGNESQCATLITQLRELSPALIIFDTLAKCNVGRDENDATAMTMFTNGMDRIADALGAMVVAVHHNNKNGTSRGSVSLPANVDTHIILKPKANRVVTVECGKQKGTPFEEFSLIGRIVELSEVDEYGRPVTSLVFDTTTTPTDETHKGEQTKEMVYQCLKNGPLTSSQWIEAAQQFCARSRHFEIRAELVEKDKRVESKDGLFYQK